MANPNYDDVCWSLTAADTSTEARGRKSMINDESLLEDTQSFTLLNILGFLQQPLCFWWSYSYFSCHWRSSFSSSSSSHWKSSLLQGVSFVKESSRPIISGRRWIAQSSDSHSQRTHLSFGNYSPIYKTYERTESCYVCIWLNCLHFVLFPYSPQFEYAHEIVVISFFV